MVLPWQAPPHTPPSVSQAARPPVGAPVTAEQVPTEPETTQDAHWSVQDVLQQTPSMHWLLAHSEPSEQLVPLDSSGTHDPPSQ